ncbi:MAG: TlyA family RNA methyltransferase [Burkholderiales bacterium]|nr:TlyA family RNA methyltransferase [Burkholderiales bacterium]
MRADLLLVERGLAPSRTAAQRLIAAGHVFTLVGRKHTRVPLTKPGVTLDDDVALEVEASELEKFVSRGGLKLDGALAKVGLDVAGLHCLDVGQSTGGFTDCLLQRGAASVVGVDVGHSQLHPRLRDDPRVTCIEGVNARSMMPSDVVVGAAEAAKPADESGNATRDIRRAHADFDLIVADVSFISLTKVLPQWPAFLREGGHVLSLVKPQFEVGADKVGRGGIVRDASLFASVEHTIRAACADAKLNVLDYFASSITGSDGNHEFFVYAERT